MGGLPGDLGIAGRLLGFRSGIAGGLLGGLMGNAGQPGSFALGSARIASDVDRVAGGLSFGECRVVYPGSRSKLLQFRLLRVRGCARRSSKLVPFRLRISPHLCEDPSDGSGYGGKTTLGDDATLAGKEHRRPLHEPARPKGRSFDKSDRNKFRICHWAILPSLNFRHFVFVRRCA